MQKTMQKWTAWFKDMSAEGQIKDPGHPLGTEGKVVNGLQKTVHDAPFVEARQANWPDAGAADSSLHWGTATMGAVVKASPPDIRVSRGRFVRRNIAPRCGPISRFRLHGAALFHACSCAGRSTPRTRPPAPNGRPSVGHDGERLGRACVLRREPQA